jgi:hypothetical protein
MAMAADGKINFKNRIVADTLLSILETFVGY